MVNDQAILDEEVRASCFLALMNARSAEEQTQVRRSSELAHRREEGPGGPEGGTA